MSQPRRAARAWLVVALVLGLAQLDGCRSGPPPSLVEQGDAAFDEGRYRAADSLYERALAHDPSSAPAMHGRARVALVSRRPEDALREYQRIARFDRAYLATAARDDYARALHAAARARLDSNEPARALEAARALEQLQPGGSGLQLLMARVLTAQGQWLAMHGQRSEALKHYEEAIAQGARITGPYIGAAEVLLATGQRKAALALLADAQRVNPGDSRVRALTVQVMGLY